MKSYSSMSPCGIGLFFTQHNFFEVWTSSCMPWWFLSSYQSGAPWYGCIRVRWTICPWKDLWAVFRVLLLWIISMNVLTKATGKNHILFILSECSRIPIPRDLTNPWLVLKGTARFYLDSLFHFMFLLARQKWPSFPVFARANLGC